MPLPKSISFRDDAFISLELRLPEKMVPQLQSVLDTVGEMEGYSCLNDLLVEAIHQELQRLHYNYGFSHPQPARKVQSADLANR